MNLDRKESICGVRASTLKNLLRRYRFSTPKAMQVLGLEEPSASQTMLALHNDGWIDFLETDEFVDHWRVGARGRRLTATKLIKRFPVAEGRKIVEAVLARARQINANPAISHRITEIRLFGSVLMGDENDDAGDVDLVVDMQQRQLPEEELKRIETLEQASAPAYLDYLRRIGWSEQETSRQIKKVSSKISLHPDSDLRAIGAPFRTVFRLDIETEREVPFDADIRSYPRTAEADEAPAGPRSVMTIPYRFDWPSSPNEPGMLDLTDGAFLQRAQHMWVRGAPIADIAKAIGATPGATQAYLASRRQLTAPQVQFDANFRTTVSQALPEHRLFYVDVTAEIMVQRDSWCDVRLLDPDGFATMARVRRGRKADACYEGRCDLFPLAEALSDAAWLWLDRMQSRSRGVSVQANAFFGPDSAAAQPSQTDPPDLRPLAAPMIGLLQELLPVPRPRYSAYSKKLEIEFSDTLRIDLIEGARYGPNANTKRVLKKQAGKLWDLAKVVREHRKDPERFTDRLRVYVSGYQLANDGDVEDEVFDADDDWT